MKDYSEFLIILDRSGSMQAAASDHEGGLNSFIQDQQKLDGDVRITLIQFDTNDPCEVVMDGVPAGKAEKVKLLPRGGTPLLDAIGLGVSHFVKRIDSQTEKPDIVVVMIITDGEENSSREWTKERVKSLVAEKEKLGWKFLYLGANVDAFHEAGMYGTQATQTNALNFHNNLVGTRGLYASVASGAICARLTVQNRKGTSSWLDQTTGGALVSAVEDALSGFNWTEEQKQACIGNGFCTCIGTANGDPKCPIHAKEVQLKTSWQGSI